MLRPFKGLKIGDEFEYNGKTYIRVETVYKTESCCIPEYNAHAKDNPEDRILVSSLKSVIRNEEV